MPLFRKSLPAEERAAALRYYQESLKVLAFHEKEADRYNEEAASFQDGPQDPEAVLSLIAAADRQVQACQEALRRHESLQTPQVAAGHFSSWRTVLDWTLKWSKANREALSLMSKGEDPSAANARSYRNVVSDFERVADGKSRDLLKRLEITQDDYSRLVSAVNAASDAENWNPA
jgi:predicted glycosyl hydrolase (DUF1957 family)